MKKILSLISLVLAINFLAVAGAVGYLAGTKKIDREKLTAIREIVFPKEAPPSTQPAVEEPGATVSPVLRLEELLARQAGRSATEQVEFIQTTFDAKQQELDRRQRELVDLKRQVDLARDQLSRDRAVLSTGQKDLKAGQDLSQKLQDDQGFQDTLALYSSMGAKQVKTIFMTLDEQVMQRYLQAMPPRTATKIVKEFKTQQELERVQRVLERMRASPPAPAEAQATAKE